MDRYEFDSEAYLHTRYGDVTAINRVQFQLNCLHSMFQSISQDGLKVLEFGCGPVVQHSISAAARASEIVFSDIAESNRNTLRKWLNNEPGAFNWSPHFDYVVKNIEGGGEKEAREREERLRQVGKEVVWCDYFSGTGIIEQGFEGPYDVVIEGNSLQSACTNLDSYKVCVRKLAGLLKPGGILALYGEDISMDTITQPYRVGDREYKCLCITRDYIKAFLLEEGFVNVRVDFIPIDLTKVVYNEKKGKNGSYFISAKCQEGDQ